MHLYTLWFGCTTSTSREDNVLKLGFLPFGPCSWPPMGDQMHMFNKWHVPFTWIIIFFWILYLKYVSEYVFSRKEEIQKFPYVTPHQSLPPPPPLPRGLSGVVLGILIWTFFIIYLWNVSNTMWFVRRSTSGCRIEDFVFKKKLWPLGPCPWASWG